MCDIINTRIEASAIKPRVTFMPIQNKQTIETNLLTINQKRIDATRLSNKYQ